jgi:DNA-binding Lrp family transcriptional regulator
MDRADRRILNALQADASVGNAQLGDSIGLSASQISRRRARLESDGIITGYHAKLSSAALGFELNAFIRVRLQAHSESAANDFRVFVQALPAIRLACGIRGDADYLVHAQLPGLKALSVLINTELLAHKLVREVRSDVVLEMIKDDSSLPVEVSIS